MARHSASTRRRMRAEVDDRKKIQRNGQYEGTEFISGDRLNARDAHKRELEMQKLKNKGQLDVTDRRQTGETQRAGMTQAGETRRAGMTQAGETRRAGMTQAGETRRADMTQAGETRRTRLEQTGKNRRADMTNSLDRDKFQFTSELDRDKFDFMRRAEFMNRFGALTSDQTDEFGRVTPGMTHRDAMLRMSGMRRGFDQLNGNGQNQRPDINNAVDGESNDWKDYLKEYSNLLNSNSWENRRLNDLINR